MKKGKQWVKRYALSAMIIITLALADSAFSAATGCNYYASPTGTGNGLSQSSPFKIANFWAVARPGSVLCLLDGTYTGSASMIDPPDNLRGVSGSPITVKALNDGKVLINGEGARRPIFLYYNDWFVIEGINAARSNSDVIEISRSNNNVLRRIAAWDAFDGNTDIFGVHNGNYNVLEDIAGWGIARKIFSGSQAGNFTTIRRAWARWEGSHVVGPKMTYSLAYNNYNTICENCIGTWSGERMKETYTLLDYYGKPWTGVGGGTYTNYAVNQPLGIFAIDGYTTTDKNARSKLLGSIAYVKATDRFHPGRAVFVTKVDSLQIANTVTYIEPGSYPTKRTFGLYNLSGNDTPGGTNLVARNLAGIGGTASYIAADWQRSNVLEGPDLGIYKPEENVFNSTRGANACTRYQDGVLTSEPLWPWPMNQRIIDATTQSGHTPVDVTATIESMFGPIPAGCKGSTTSANSTSTASTLPSAPSNLQATP